MIFSCKLGFFWGVVGGLVCSISSLTSLVPSSGVLVAWNEESTQFISESAWTELKLELIIDIGEKIVEFGRKKIESARIGRFQLILVETS